MTATHHTRRHTPRPGAPTACRVWGAADRAGEVCAIVLVHLRDGHNTDGMLARVNKVPRDLGKPSLADVQPVSMLSVPVGVTGKVLKSRLRQTYAGTAHQPAGPTRPIPAQ